MSIFKKKEIPQKLVRANGATTKRDQILRVIVKEFRPVRRPAVKEKEFERELFQFLRGRFHKLNFDYQNRSLGGICDITCGEQSKRADLLGFELKIDCKASVQRALSQVTDYLKHYKAIGVVILDTGSMRPEDIEAAKDRLNREKRIKCVVIRP